MKNTTETKILSKEWERILVNPSNRSLKIKYKKEKNADWMYKALGWKHDGRE